MSRAPGDRRATFRISAVAERFGIHPQTLRMYEREGLLCPSRSSGNTRLYTEEDMADLQVILHLTRDLGVNLAGVEVVLNMRERILALQRDMRRLVALLHDDRTCAASTEALIPVSTPGALAPRRGPEGPDPRTDPIDRRTG